MKNALIIFIRNPEKGKVKSRLAKDLGEGRTLEVYKFLLQHTRDVCADADVHRFVFYSDYINLNDAWNEPCFAKHLQEGDDLGERMMNAFAKVFDFGFERIAIIGSDCYELTTAHLDDAFAQLEEFDAVIGPSKDGGYYLLGMKQLHPALFTEKKWGSDSVLINTLDDFELQGTNYIELPPLNDIDTLADLLETDIPVKCNLDLPK